MLTHKQRELLLLIYEHTKDGGVPPSFDEMKDEIGLKSKSGIHRLITGLEERGFIRRLPNKARALEVMRLPDDMRDAPLPDRGHLGGSQALFTAPSQPANNDNISLPLYGRIAAGHPIEAISDPNQFVDVPPSMLGPGKYYALEVDGESMIEAGIHDGDTAIIRQMERVTNGDIAVCLVDGEEVTLKFFRQDNSTVTLTPANRSFETRVLPYDRVQVQGRLQGLLRRY